MGRSSLRPYTTSITINSEIDGDRLGELRIVGVVGGAGSVVKAAPRRRTPY
jgi:hypothetical protein